MKIKQAPILAMAAGFALSLAGCNSPTSGNPQTGADQSPTPASSAAVASAAKTTGGTALQLIDETLLTSARSVGACALDQVDGAQVVDSVNLKKGGSFTVTGWSSDEKMHAPPQVTLVLQGAQLYGATVPTGQPRPDVAKSLGSDLLANSGFSAPIDLSTAVPGDYVVKVLVQESGDSQLCDTKKHLVISN